MGRDEGLAGLGIFGGAVAAPLGLAAMFLAATNDMARGLGQVPGVVVTGQVLVAVGIALALGMAALSRLPALPPEGRGRAGSGARGLSRACVAAAGLMAACLWLWAQSA